MGDFFLYGRDTDTEADPQILNALPQRPGESFNSALAQRPRGSFNSALAQRPSRAYGQYWNQAEHGLGQNGE